MKVAEALKNAYAVIKDKEHWAKGTLARGKDGTRSPPNAPEAFAFCALGAIHRTAIRPCVPLIALRRVAQEKFGRDVEDVNNVLGHPFVCELFEAAITRYETTEFELSPSEVNVYSKELDAFLKSPS